MKWYIWVLIVVTLFAAGYFTGDMVAKNKAAKLEAAKRTGLGLGSTGMVGMG